ncbi:MAG TPA: SPFH domain-containing protein [Phycisphaerales bacterium]|nr:SPFH domain-containing protein [Phycisphaerales bacterium]
MKADHQSYGRAARVATLGLAIQVVLAVAMLLYGIYGRDHAALTGAYFILIGLPAWLTLIILFDQHRRERLEAQEADSFAAVESSSVFDAGSAELRVAAKRLNAIYRFVLPVVSLLIAGALFGTGYWRLQSGRGLIQPGSLEDAALPGWAIAVGLCVAFIGFVFARFVSGMAKQPIWANLRGGATYSVGAALVGLAVVLAHFIDVAGSDAVRRVLPAVVPVVMIALGVEVVLNFLLAMYRPRKKGEHPRPAFDSQILAFLAAPDRLARSVGEALDYQFGFEVRGTWFYRLITRAWVLLALLGVCVVWLLSSLAVVQPHQRGMMLRFGRVVHEDLGPGLHFKAPWPIDRLVVPEQMELDSAGRSRVVARTATGVRVLNLGTPPAEGTGPILWTTEHAKDEIFFVCQPSGIDRPGQERARDLALIAIEVPLHYAVSNPRLYDELGPPAMRDDILRAVGQRAVTRFVSSVSIDDAVGMNRARLSERLRVEIQAAFDALNPDPAGRPRGAGVDILQVGVAGVHPPREVAPKFEQVVIAQQNRAAKIESARADEAQTLSRVAGSVEAARRIALAIEASDGASQQAQPELTLEAERLIEDAAGEAARILAQARAERWRTHMAAKSQAAEYAGRVAAYRASPMVYRAGLYYAALLEAMKDARLYVTPEHLDNIHVRVELQDRTTAGSTIFTDETSESP